MRVIYLKGSDSEVPKKLTKKQLQIQRAKDWMARRLIKDERAAQRRYDKMMQEFLNTDPKNED